MNKQSLVDAVSESTLFPKSHVEKMLNAMVRVIQDRVKAGEDVTIMGFGTFSAGLRKARKGHDPFRQKAIDIPAQKQPRFRAGKEFKELLNRKK